MTVDQGEVVKSQETLGVKRPRLLFHVSAVGETAIESMKQFGLVAKGPTLTPRLDIATHYSGGDFLTFWYPARGEVDYGRSHETQTPSLPISDDMKEEMLQTIDKLDMDQFFKNAQERVVKAADSYLPGKRLGAVAKLRYSPPPLQLIFPEDPEHFISVFNRREKDMAERVKKALEHMDIQFIDLSLNRDILADDIMRTYVEHNLSALGNYDSDNKASLEKKLRTLEEGNFENRVYERYRKMIISGIKRKLAPLLNNSSEIK